MRRAENRPGAHPVLYLFGVTFLVALAVRLLYLLDSADSPTFYSLVVDSHNYDQLARDLADGEPMTPAFFWQPFLYPFVLSWIYRLGGTILQVKLLQAILGALTCGLTALLSRRLLGVAAGVVTGAILTFYGPLLFFEAELLATGWAAFWSVCLIGLFLDAERGRLLRVAASGVVGALSILTRPSFLPFFAAGVIWLLLRWRRAMPGRSQVLVRIAVLAAGFLVPALPVALQNLRVTGHFGMLPYSGGINTYIGNNPESCATLTTRPGPAWIDLVETPDREGIAEPWEKQRYFYGQVLSFARTAPLHFGQTLLQKTVHLLSAVETPRNIDTYQFRDWSILLRVLLWRVPGLGFPWGVLLPLSLVGLWFMGRRTPVPLWLFLVFYSAAIVLVFVTARYRVPLVPVLSIPAAAGVLEIGRRLRHRRWRAGLSALAICAGMTVASSLAQPFCSDSTNYRADLFYAVGLAQGDRGELAAAVDSYHKSLAVQPLQADVQFNLGSLMVRMQRPDQTVLHYTEALRLASAGGVGDRQYAEIHNGLGSALLGQRQADAAAIQFQQALQRQPAHTDARLNLGLALILSGQASEAVKHLQITVGDHPDSAKAHFNLGRAYLLDGQLAAGIQELNRSLRLRPTPAGHLEMGRALASAGDVPAAHSHFQQAIHLQTNFVPAYQAAAALHLQQGEIGKALELLSRAARLAPQDAGVHFQLGETLLLAGQTAQARAAFERVLALEPDHAATRARLRSIR